MAGPEAGDRAGAHRRRASSPARGGVGVRARSCAHLRAPQARGLEPLPRHDDPATRVGARSWIAEPKGPSRPRPSAHERCSNMTSRSNSRRCSIYSALARSLRSAKASGADYVRDAAFSFLNRIVALKMLEARGLVRECVSRGEQSAGYVEFCGLAPGVQLLKSAGYRLYLESLFDELATEVKVL